MFNFIDESGDPGFKFGSGSSDLFVVAMVIFHNEASCDQARLCIRDLKSRLGFTTEFKFSKSRLEVRDEFLHCLAGVRFSVRGLVVQKRQLQVEPRLLDNESFYEHFLRVAFQRCCRDVEAAQIVIDGAADKIFQRKLRLVASPGAGHRGHKIRTKDSRTDELLQLADMAAGAIARAYKIEGGSRRWLSILEGNGQLGNLHRY